MSIGEWLLSMLKRGAIVILICAVIFGGAFVIAKIRGPIPKPCPCCGRDSTHFVECPFCSQMICDSCASDYEVYAAEYLEGLGYTVIEPYS